MPLSVPDPQAIDRLAPTRRPAGHTVMRQRWRDLLFLHWAVSPEILRPLVPPGLEIDTFAGQAYVGLVPFTMRGVRPTLLPAFPPLSNFHEVNVRTYVHRQGGDPGVWFFSLDAANKLAVRIARAWFKLPYFYANMTTTKRGSKIEYRSDRVFPAPLPAHCRLVYIPEGEPYAAEVGTLEHFLVERYLLYSEAQGRLYRGQVHHAPYEIQPVSVTRLEENLVSAAGVTRPDTAPLVHFARGVNVQVFPLHRV